MVVAVGSASAPHRVYDASKMYGAQTAFASGEGFVRRLAPVVLTAPRTTPIHINFGNISGPLTLGLPAQLHTFGSYNPSLVAAPTGLCPRCAYVASLRVEALHQCDQSSPLFRAVAYSRVSANSYYRGTAIAVLDKGLRLLGYTWLITSHNQIHDDRALRRWTIPYGVSDAFPPSWGHAIYDVRLINVDGRIFTTYVCHGCTFGLLLLHLTADVTPDGGLHHLRAWRSQRFVSSTAWSTGRNQAVFSARRTPSSPTEIFVQPWLSLIASFGVPRFFALNVSCYRTAPPEMRAHNYVRKGIYTCMHNAKHSLLRMEQIDSDADAESERGLRKNHQKRKAQDERPVRRRQRGVRGGGRSLSSELTGNGRRLRQRPGDRSFGSELELVANLTSDVRSMQVDARPHRISTTAHLVRINDTAGNGLLLGIAHIRRKVGDCIGKRRGRQCNAFRARQLATAPPFRFGYQYTHFFYVLTLHAPFRIVSTSREFCLGSAQDPADCESVQFITGLALRGESTLLMAYGINDCEAKVAELPVKSVLEMLLPLPSL